MIGNEVSHYRILERIGGGGMGVVYKAEDTRLGRPVALKFLNPGLLANESTRKRFLHEARAASVIDHPNVCHVYEVAETDDGRLFLAMSYCEGRSLREVIDSGPVPAREAFSIAFGIAQGLWAAHRRGIVHRDIKPGNVILTDEGYVRIVDFGLALLIGHSRVTTSGVTVGTVAYMSPEQSTGALVGANTDIWSLGVTLYELMTGQLPFRGEINPAMVYSIVHEQHTPAIGVNPSIPTECSRVIDRCLEKDPAKRYQTAEDLLADMVRVARELGWESSVASATIAPILRARRWKVWRKRLLVAAAAVVVAGTGAWGAYRWAHRTPSPYTTEIRMAVMPLDNLIGGEHEAFVDGLSDHLARVARWVGQRHPSMWTALYLSVQNAHLPTPTAAAPAFGVNRVLTGDVQRFENGQRLHLNLLDAQSGAVLREAVVPFDLAAPVALTDTLLAATARLVGLSAQAMRADSPWRCRDAWAVRMYFEGLSLLEHSKDAGALEHAVAVLDSCAALDPGFAAATCAGGLADYRLYLRSHSPELLARARERGRAARAVCPGFADADLLLGDVFRSMEEADSAETCFRTAIAAEPGFVTASQHLGNLYVSQNRIDEAERVYRDLTIARPDLWSAHRSLGVFYFNQGRLDEAATAWQTALTLAPRDGLTLNNLGVIHHRRGEWAQARELFLQSFRIRPDCESCNNVAMTLYFDSQFADAAKYFQFALEHCDTTDHLAWGNLARAMYWAPGERDQSIATYRKALRIARAELDRQPDDPDLIAQVMDYSAMVGDSSGTRAMLARVKPFLEENERVMYRVGAVYEKLGQREAALDLIGNAVRHGFALPEIRGDPMLRDLVLDPRFQEMVRTEAAANGAEAASTTH